MSIKVARTMMIIVILLVSSVTTVGETKASTDNGSANFSGSADGVQITIINPEGFSPMEANWPIIKHDYYRYVDPNTGLLVVHETTYREILHEPVLLDDQSCNKLITDFGETFIPLASCNSVGNVSVTDSDRLYNGSYYVEARLTNYAHKICHGSCGPGTQYYQMY